MRASNISASNREVKWTVRMNMKRKAERDLDWSGKYFTKLTIRLQTGITKLQPETGKHRGMCQMQLQNVTYKC